MFGVSPRSEDASTGNHESRVMCSLLQAPGMDIDASIKNEWAAHVPPIRLLVPQIKGLRVS